MAICAIWSSNWQNWVKSGNWNGNVIVPDCKLHPFKISTVNWSKKVWNLERCQIKHSCTGLRSWLYPLSQVIFSWNMLTATVWLPPLSPSYWNESCIYTLSGCMSEFKQNCDSALLCTTKAHKCCLPVIFWRVRNKRPNVLPPLFSLQIKLCHQWNSSLSSFAVAVLLYFQISAVIFLNILLTYW